jgi:hypothetical protein
MSDATFHHISPLERTEGATADLAERVHAVECAGDVYQTVLDDLTRRQAGQLGVEVDDWGLADPPGGQLGGAVDGFWDEVDDPAELLDEPHLLGWFHQHYGEPARAASHRAHNAEEAKHDSASVTTQLYTPRWIADILAEGALEAAEVDRPTVLDPAVGGGQMLLAAWDAVARREPGATAAEIAGRLSGTDIDARAVEACRRALKLHAAREAGGRDPAAEAAIDDNIRPADGLFDDLAGADIALTNPPYMGSRSMPAELKGRVRERYEPFHADLYAAFIRRCHELADGAVGVLAQQTIWYLKRYRKARADLLERGDLTSFVHLGPHAFDALSGEKANVVAFVQRSGARSEDHETDFVDLRDEGSPADKRRVLMEGGADRQTRLPVDRLRVIPGQPVSYWLDERLRRHFDGGRRLGDIAEVPGSQHKTAANKTYVKKWWEVGSGELHRGPMALDPADAPERLAPEEGARWIFYSKGGRFSPWWGNWEHVVDWSAAARDFYDENSTSNLLAAEWRFRQGICYTDFAGRTFNARWMPPGCLFDMAGPAIFPDTDDHPDPSRRLFALLAVLNSSPVRQLLNALNPSIHYQVTDLRRLPVPEFDIETEARLAEMALDLVRAVRQRDADAEASPVVLSEDVDTWRDDVVERHAAEIDQLVTNVVYG